MYNIHRINSVGGCGKSVSSITYTGVCTCILQLLVALQMLMTLEMPLSTTMALPVTSKPIESTAENLAWQAWIMLPPEQKQLIKSRKVTPKSIFTIPLRVDCPEGHQQVDTKCIPTVIGSNTVLIDPNVLGVVLGGNNPTDIEYDYEDEMMTGDEDTKTKMDSMPYNPPLHLKDPVAEETTKDELQPPSPDEPLKFNIFQSTFPTDDYAMEDYSSVSNEGSASGGGQIPEMSPNVNTSIVAVNETINITFNISSNVSLDRDLVSEASSNISKVHSFTTLPDSNDFNLDDIDAISLPASGGDDETKSHKISLFKEDSSLHLVTSDMETETDDRDNEKEYATQATAETDLETLLQTESLMPMINQSVTTITPQNLTVADAVISTKEPLTSDITSTFYLNIGSEEMTTLPSQTEKDLDTMATQDKAEFIRSVTMSPQTSAASDEGYGIEITTLTSSNSYDELYDKISVEEEDDEGETATSPTIQLDETTIIEGNDEFSKITTGKISATAPSSSSSSSSLSSLISQSKAELFASPSSLSSSYMELSSSSPMAPTPTAAAAAEELTTLLWQQEQALKDFEELQRLRKGQKDQHFVKKKSKVEPVGVVATDATNLAETQTSETTTDTTINVTDELMTATETEIATVTPLFKVNTSNDSDKNNKNINNDRFYYQHFAKQNLETQHEQPSSTSMPPTTAWSTDIETLKTPTTITTTPITKTTVNGETTSEIDLAQELRLINDLVKGKRSNNKTKATSTTTTSTIPKTTTLRPPSSTVKSTVPVLTSSESSVNSLKQSRATAEIWSKIMPLLQTTAVPYKTTPTLSESLSTTKMEDMGTTTLTDTSASTPAVVSNRSHRNSKIIRINGFNTIHATPPTVMDTTITTTTTTTTATTSRPLTTSDDNSRTIKTTTLSDETDESSLINVEVSSTTNDSSESFWWLPVAWRLDKSTTTVRTPTLEQKLEQTEGSSEEIPLLLRFWSAYHAPKSS